ncbi:MAG: DUF1007 family protein [Hoeflea sp.]|uniref:DUF1007 family protein n=1 Tax=Hoeflea sp. TaxID=1940281 RepID=UPI001DAC7B1A|nr:DUF1007 family protein [Hoeflea sp.]MBU4529307.1 DUF1007 family protein [Alphaproteobacteria bacterium]MBU4545474.1 DUF1007 family protein [Alphaproteobacteria bacterium]MBU4550189.1 DUF1007 family protein [Alphaproteobacteria bacterium]MBV1723230.1 DUF1007 family protein [Hoeflea sp.]MBV1782903.1 DUF1007 family protein [Hoeflea sp.]
MYISLRLLFWAFTSATVLLSATLARAHPHILAEARLDVIVNSDETVRFLRHFWRFDEIFSSSVVLDFDANNDLKLDDEELQKVSTTIFESLADYNYFQLVTSNGEDIVMNRPARFNVSYDQDQLIVLFEAEPKDLLKLAGKVVFGVYDPTFYVAIDFVKDGSLAVEGLPARCTRAVIRPDPNQAITDNQDNLTDEFFNDPAGTDISKIFATRLELNCTAKG